MASFLVLVSFLALVPLRPAQAWSTAPALAVKQLAEVFARKIESVILGAAKQAAAKAINMAVSRIVGGGSGEPMFITNWESYLVQKPRQETQTYMNDYLSQVTRGKGASANYIPAEGVGQGAFASGMGINGNYTQALVESMKKTTLDNSRPSLNENTVNPAMLFAKGNFKEFNSSLSSLQVPWALRANLEETEAKVLADKQATAAAKGVAGQGFTGQEKDGSTITPAALIKEEMANVEDIGNKVVAGANGIGEVLASAAVNMLTKTITQGIGNAASKVSNKAKEDPYFSSFGQAAVESYNATAGTGSTAAGSGNN